MERNDTQFRTFLKILEEELIPAMGCTEPIAVAYASAKARKVLAHKPDHIIAEVSSSIIKNVKSVIVPNTGHMKGIAASVSAGTVAGNSEKKLEVLADVRKEQIGEIEEYMKKTPIEVKYLDRGHLFDIIITACYQCETAQVQIQDYHTNIIKISKNHEVLFEAECEHCETHRADRSIMNMKNIWDFAMLVKPSDVTETIGKQIIFNSAISKEGLRGNYGANIGRTLLEKYENSIENKAAASAAAGSDARMSGCEMPVIINSGSGNQGIACSMPVITYAREMNICEEKMIAALALSNLTAIYQKEGIGTLSAYCGVISAGIGAAAGISYLKVGTFDAFEHTVTNALGIASGIICDGAKPSCAAKSCLAVQTGLFSLNMYCNEQALQSGDGIIAEDTDSTVRNVWRIASEGMHSTNDTIIDLMINSD